METDMKTDADADMDTDPAIWTEMTTRKGIRTRPRSRKDVEH